MLSRRSFLTQALGSLALFEFGSENPAWALKRGKKPATGISGPHSLAKQAWPPAIVPDHVDLEKKGYLCFSDQFGRFAVADLRKAASAKVPPRVIAELTSLGKRVVALRVARLPYAYLLVKDPAEGTDSKNFLVTIDLRRPDLPSVVSRTELRNFEDADILMADKDCVFVAGRSRNGEYLVTLFSPPGKGGQTEASTISSIASKLPVTALDYQRRQLIVVQDAGANTRLDFYNMAQFASPQQVNSLELKGSMSRLSRIGDTLILAGTADQSGRQMQVSTIALKPAPHAVSNLQLEATEQILSTAVQKGQFFALTKGNGGKLMLNVLSIDKFNNLARSQAIEVPSAKSASVEKATLVVNGKEMYVASGWSGVQVLNLQGGQWVSSYNYKIPRLAAAGMAIWGSNVVLVGAELMLYDIADPEHPTLVKSAPLTSSIKAMVGAGSFILCLDKDSLSLRKMAQLDGLVASVKVSGRALSFDKSLHKAFVIDALGKLTRVTPVKVFSDNLEIGKSFDIPGNFTNIEATNGLLLASDIHEVGLFSLDGQVKEIGRRKIENLAVRDICITDHNVLATAVDKDSKGFLLVLSRNDKELNIEGTIDLPHNGTALSATSNRAVAVGQDASGKDLVSVIDISNSAAPTVKATFNVLEAASAVAVQNKMALVAGRGLEIVTL